MIRGIGVDAVTVSELERLLEGPDNFASYAFTEQERNQAQAARTLMAQKLAGCFAAKEAAFKAIGHLAPHHPFDYRAIELLRDESGRPFISLNETTVDLLRTAGVDSLHVSLTNEQDLVLAFVVAEANA